MVCNNLESSCVRSGCGHAWTPRRDFAVSKSVTQSLTIGSVAFQKAGAHRVTLRADPVGARHGPTRGPAGVASGREPRLPLGAGAASIGQFNTLTHRAPGLRRSAGVEITRTSEPNGRNRNGQGARLDTNFRPQNYGAVGKTLLATTRHRGSAERAGEDSHQRHPHLHGCKKAARILRECQCGARAAAAVPGKPLEPAMTRGNDG